MGDNTNIAGKTRSTVECKCIAAYDEVLNVVSVEQLEKFFEVPLYLHSAAVSRNPQPAQPILKVLSDFKMTVQTMLVYLFLNHRTYYTGTSSVRGKKKALRDPQGFNTSTVKRKQRKYLTISQPISAESK